MKRPDSNPSSPERGCPSTFHSWIPRFPGAIILLLMFVPPTFSGGAYLNNLSEMAGGLGVWSEDIQAASFFTSIGMCLFPPFMVLFLQNRRPKQTFLWCFGLLVLLNLVCAFTTSLPLLFAACLLTGFVRVVAMLNCTFTIAPYLTGMDNLSMFTLKEEPPADVQYALERKRTFLMPVLYFYILLISQLSNMFTAWFAYTYRWQYAYLAVVALLLLSMIIVLCTMRDEPRSFSYRAEWRKMPGMLLMAVALCSMTYVLTYGKTLDWLSSPAIVIALVVMLVAFGVFLIVPVCGEYLPLHVFTYRNVMLSMLLFMLTMLFNSANGFISMFARLSTSADNIGISSLGGWAAFGCLLGFLVSVILVVCRVRFRTVFCIGYLFMAVANACLYFQFQTEGLLSRLQLPMVLNFTGLLMLYSLVAAFGMKGLPSRYIATFVFLMIWMRNAIAPVVGSSVYSNWLDYRQHYYASRLAPPVVSNHAAVPVPQLSLRVVRQSTLVAMRDITGTTAVLLAFTSVAVLMLPYRRGETT